MSRGITYVPPAQSARLPHEDTDNGKYLLLPGLVCSRLFGVYPLPSPFIVLISQIYNNHVLHLPGTVLGDFWNMLKARYVFVFICLPVFNHSFPFSARLLLHDKRRGLGVLLSLLPAAACSNQENSKYLC